MNFTCETFSVLNIVLIQVEHRYGIIIRFAGCKRLVNLDICSMKIVYKKFVLTNIILNALTVSSTADVSIYKKHLKKSKIVWTVTHVTACHQLE